MSPVSISIASCGWLPSSPRSPASAHQVRRVVCLWEVHTASKRCHLCTLHPISSVRTPPATCFLTPSLGLWQSMNSMTSCQSSDDSDPGACAWTHWWTRSLCLCTLSRRRGSLSHQKGSVHSRKCKRCPYWMIARAFIGGAHWGWCQRGWCGTS